MGLFGTKQPAFTAIIQSVTQEAEEVRRFVFSVRTPQPFAFKAGQFVTFRIPHDGKTIARSYSIASDPCTNGQFELIIVHKPHGTGTDYIWSHFLPGTEITGQGPSGKFLFRCTLDEEVCFVATGTGIAPLRSMILDQLINHRHRAPITLIAGFRTQADILYRNEFDALAASYPQFRFIPVLSRENAAEWTGLRGHVHDVYQELFAGRRNITFYLCGWKTMLDEATLKLLEMGVTKDRIRFESYD